MELILYIISLCVSLFGLVIYKSKKTLLVLFMWLFTIFTVIPSYYSYRLLFLGDDFNLYFLSVLIFQIVILCGVMIQEKRRLSIDLSFLRSESVFSTTLLQKIGAFTILLFCILYLYIGISAMGGLPWLLWIKGDFAVQYRMELWNNVLGNIPGSSAIRFFAKFGAVFLSIYYFHIRKKNKAIFYLVLASLTFTLEGTKASLLLLFSSYIIYLFLYKRKYFKRWVPLLVVIILFGTVWLALTEARGDFQVAIKEKVIERALFVPSNVSLIHYYVNKDRKLLGKTNGLISEISGDTEFLEGSRNYDNYIMKWYRKNILNTEAGSGGSLNAPGFIYGWVDFGLIGIILLAILSVLLFLVLDYLTLKGDMYPPFLATVPLFILLYATSGSYWNILWGMEGVWMLLVLNLLFKKKELRVHILYWTILFLGAVYNGSSFLFRLI